jgi:hypothetical protein
MMQEANRAAEERKLDEAIAAARELADAPVPSLDECAERVRRDPELLGRAQEKVKNDYLKLRYLPGAPAARIDRLWLVIETQIRGCGNHAAVLRRLFQAEREIAALSAQRRSFGVMAFQDTEAARPPAPAVGFDANRYLTQLGQRGITLTLVDGKLHARRGALTGGDKRTVDENRAAIIGALGSTEEI